MYSSTAALDAAKQSVILVWSCAWRDYYTGAGLGGPLNSGICLPNPLFYVLWVVPPHCLFYDVPGLAMATALNYSTNPVRCNAYGKP